MDVGSEIDSARSTTNLARVEVGRFCGADIARNSLWEGEYFYFAKRVSKGFCRCVQTVAALTRVARVTPTGHLPQ